MTAVALAEAAAMRNVALRIPADLPYQLIYRMRRDTPYAVDARTDVDFHYVAGLWQYLSLTRALRRVAGSAEWLRGIARMLAGRRFYCIVRGGSVLHHGWANVGVCRHYKVSVGEVVIGPIWSAPSARGMGLATHATQQAINRLVAEGHAVFYIDTSWDNLACQAVIARCGFGDAMGCMPRERD